jgi:phospholipid/cholesterol/gamma-HCH transport system permease protein
MALVVTGRSGSAICTEIGTMRVTEQIDAMETMAVNPVQYLAVPRFLAAVAMFPLLTMLFNALGYAGAYLMGIYVAEIPAGPFIEHTRTFVEPKDILHGLLKSILFGGVVAIITAYRGYSASGGSRGVGEGTTRAVVMSSIAILVVDYAVTLITVGSGR